MILYREISWWYWAVTALLLVIGLAGWFEALYLAVALSAVQIVHFRIREGRSAAFPVQVRLAYTGLPGAGTLDASELALLGLGDLCFGTDALASALQPARAAVLASAWRTFVTPPVRGNILQGQSALRRSLAPAGR